MSQGDANENSIESFLLENLFDVAVFDVLYVCCYVTKFEAKATSSAVAGIDAAA
jgi:hypothetical protein